MLFYLFYRKLHLQYLLLKCVFTGRIEGACAFAGEKNVAVFNVKRIVLKFEHFENIHLKYTPPLFRCLNTLLLLLIILYKQMNI